MSSDEHQWFMHDQALSVYATQVQIPKEELVPALYRAVQDGHMFVFHGETYSRYISRKSVEAAASPQAGGK